MDMYAFAPNSASVDGKYYSPLGTAVTTTISNSEVITAGRFSGGNFWFMATDKAASNINYTSALSGEDMNVRFNYGILSNYLDRTANNDLRTHLHLILLLVVLPWIIRFQM